MWDTAGADELKAVTDAIGHGISVMEVYGRRFKVLSINRRVEQFAGLDHSRISGHFLDEVHPAALAEKLTANYRFLESCSDAGQGRQRSGRSPD